MGELSRHDRFMKLFLPSQQKLHVYLRTLLFNSSDVDDVLQVAAAVMWEKFDEFQPGTRFECWAYEICRLQALCHLKGRKRDRLVLGDDVLASLADRAATVSDRTGDVVEILGGCVEKLVPEDQELLQMRFEPQATNRSVARKTGRSEMSISRALSQIYGRLLGCVQRGLASLKLGGR